MKFEYEKIFSAEYLNSLSEQPKSHERRRQHNNIHKSYQEPCQRLFNAIEPNTYIRLHRHAIDKKDELLVAIRGLMVLMIFDESGNVMG